MRGGKGGVLYIYIYICLYIHIIYMGVGFVQFILSLYEMQGETAA